MCIYIYIYTLYTCVLDNLAGRRRRRILRPERGPLLAGQDAPGSRNTNTSLSISLSIYLYIYI